MRWRVAGGTGGPTVFSVAGTVAARRRRQKGASDGDDAPDYQRAGDGGVEHLGVGPRAGSSGPSPSGNKYTAAA